MTQKFLMCLIVLLLPVTLSIDAPPRPPLETHHLPLVVRRHNYQSGSANGILQNSSSGAPVSELVWFAEIYCSRLSFDRDDCVYVLDLAWSPVVRSDRAGYFLFDAVTTHYYNNPWSEGYPGCEYPCPGYPRDSWNKYDGKYVLVIGNPITSAYDIIENEDGLPAIWGVDLGHNILGVIRTRLSSVGWAYEAQNGSFEFRLNEQRE